MNFDLRNAVIKNLDDSNYDEIRETILDAVESGEEKTLPGLGVLFEVLWNGSSDTEKESMVSRITQCLKPKAM
ncbi:MAG TPA: small acid-soluble spore protein SspI [Firmicutes bacterium]|nr:small acid-soluble spore protein SspI [Bacillota bacterium]